MAQGVENDDYDDDDDDNDDEISIDDFRHRNILIKAVKNLYEKMKMKIPDIAELSIEKVKEGIIKRNLPLDELGELYNAVITEAIDETKPDKRIRKKLTDLYV